MFTGSPRCKFLGTENISCWTFGGGMLSHSFYLSHIYRLQLFNSPRSSLCLYFLIHHTPNVFSWWKLWTTYRTACIQAVPFVQRMWVPCFPNIDLRSALFQSTLKKALIWLLCMIELLPAFLNSTANCVHSRESVSEPWMDFYESDLFLICSALRAQRSRAWSNIDFHSCPMCTCPHPRDFSRSFLSF